MAEFNPFEEFVSSQASRPLDDPLTPDIKDDEPDPFAGFVEQERKRDQQQALNTVADATPVNPDTYAAMRTMAQDVNINTRMLLGDVEPDKLRTKHVVEQTRSFLKENPRVERFLRDPDSVRLTHDDIAGLRSVHEASKRLSLSEEDKGFGEVTSGIAERLPKIFEQVGIATGAAVLEGNEDTIFPHEALAKMDDEEKAAYNAMDTREKVSFLFSDKNKKRFKSELGKEGREKVSASLDEVTRELNIMRARAPKEGVAFYASAIAEGTAAMLPAIATGMLTKNPKLALSIMYTQAFGGRYAQARERGKKDGTTQSDAFAEAFVFAGLEVVSEKIPLGILLSEGGRGFRGIFKSMGAEAIQETFIEGVDIGFEMGLLNKDMTVPQAFARLRDAAIIGAGVGGTLRGGVQGVRRLAEIGGLRRAGDDAQDYETRLTDAQKAVQEAKLAARSPEKMKEFLDQSNDDATVHISAEDVIELQQSGVLTDEVMAELELNEEMAETAARNGDFEISVSKLLMLDEATFSAVSPSIREKPNSLSAKEATSQVADREALIKTLVEQMNTQLDEDPDATPIADAVGAALAATGKFTAAEIGQQAELAEATYQTRAENLEGVTAEELFLEENVQIRGPADTTRNAATVSFNQVDRTKLDFKDVTKSVPGLAEAAAKRQAGEITAEEYQREVDKLKTVLPFDIIPAPATVKEMRDALDKNKKSKLGQSKKIPIGHRVGIRLDIPAYTNHGVWVPTIHNTPVGNVHEAAVHITNVDFEPTDKEQEKAAGVSQGGSKAPFARIDGDFQSADADALAARAAEVLNDPEWTQVGYDPQRHSFFYDRTTGEPILSATEVIQVGPLILARNAVKGEAQDFLFQRPVSSADTPAPQHHTLTKADNKRIKGLKKKVPGLGRLLPLLQADEQALLTETSAKNFVELYNKMPSPQEMAEVALSGVAKRGWYLNSGRALVEIFGEDAPRFAALLAALSPQTSVESNTTNALGVWGAWIAAGRPTDPNQIIRLMGEHVQGDKGEDSVLGAWRNNTVNALTSTNPATITISGPKVNSFMLNLLGFFNEVTNDAWMANYTGVAQEVFSKNQAAPGSGKSAGYLALSARARKAAQVLSKKTGEEWTGAEVQETIWSWAKALYEKADAQGETRTALKILREGGLTHEEINAVPDFEQLFVVGEYRQLLEQAGYGDQLKVVDASVQERLAASTPPTGSVYEGANAHLHRAANRLNDLAKARAAAKVRADVKVTLSATTDTIPGLNALHEAVREGDEAATVLLQEVARDALTYLTSKIKSVEIEYAPSTGLYDGDAEPSLGLSISFQERDRPAALAALAKFAENFNQEQVHVRGDAEPRTKVGHVYPDGSYNTDVVVFRLETPLSRSDTEDIISGSGLFGFTASDKTLEAYYVGDPKNEEALADFRAAVIAARKLLGNLVTDVDRGTSRFWAYGKGEGATHGYGEIQREFRPPTQDQAVATAQRVASRLAAREVQGTEQADLITENQQALHERIAEAYEALPVNDLANPDVRRAYEELAAEVLEQYDALPIKVEIFDGKGEPYTKGKKVSSAKMRQDILHNNHLFIFGTEVAGFGPPGVTYDNHPLLEDAGRKDENGVPLLFNDLFRAVHDYYAHTIQVTTFGPKGEEAAWATHMEMTKSPWARWALTSETRGQNSWVNFRKSVKGVPLNKRGFAEQKVGLLPLEFVATGKPDVDASLGQLPGSEGLTLEQNNGAAKGSFRQEQQTYGDISNIITLTENADRTTFLHELGHFWLFQMNKDLVDTRLTKQGRVRLERMMANTKKWFGQNSADGWRDYQKLEQAAREDAQADPENTSKQLKATRMAAAMEHAKKNGGAIYMAQVAEAFMDGTVDFGTDLEVGFHEMWARGVEKWLGQGKAPSSGLREAFSNFSTWVIGVYKKLATLNVNLSPEITDVFDRLVATEEMIQQERGRTLYSIPDDLRQQATPKELAALEKAEQDAMTEARAQMQGKVGRQLAKERGDEFRAEAERLTQEITEEVSERPIHKAEGILKSNLLFLDRAEFVAVYGKDAAKRMPRGAFTKAKGADMIPLGNLAHMAGFDSQEAMVNEMLAPHASLATVVKAEVDVRLAEKFGTFLEPDRLADEAAEVVQNEKMVELMALQARLVRRLAKGPLKTIAERRAQEEGVDTTAAEDRGAVEDAERGAEAAPTPQDAVPGELAVAQTKAEKDANVAQRRAQRAAVRRIRELARSMDTAAIKEAARQITEKMTVGKMTSQKFRQTADRLAKKAQLAIAKRDYTEAANLLQERTLNLEIAREVTVKRAKVDQVIKQAQKILGRSDKQLKNGYDIDIIQTVRMMLEPYGVLRSRSSQMPADEFLATLKNVDPNLAGELGKIVENAVRNAEPYIVRTDGKMPYKAMSYTEFMVLMNEVRGLITQARDGQTVKVDGERVTFDRINEEVARSTIDLAPVNADNKARGTDNQRDWKTAIGAIRTWTRRVELWARAIDGGSDGPMQKYIVRPVMNGITAYQTARIPLVDKLHDLLTPVADDLAKPTRIDAPELDGYFFNTKAELLHFMLHTGNASNERKLLIGGATDINSGREYQWTKTIDPREEVDTGQLETFINRMFAEGVLTQADVDLLNGIWAIFDETKVGAQKAHREMHGHFFDEIDATARQTPFGELTGGYVPAIADNLMNPEGTRKEAADDLGSAQNAAMFPGAEDGFTKGRVEYNQPLALDLRMIPMHIDKVLKFTHIGPPVRNAARIAVNKKFQATVNKFDHFAVGEIIIPWLNRSARQTVTEPGNRSADKFFTALSRNIGLQTMMGNIVNAGQQLTGLITATSRVKSSLLIKNLARFRKDGETGRAYVSSRSPFMAVRLLDSVNDLTANVSNVLTANTTIQKGRFWANKYGYILQQMAQNMVDPVVWMAAEEQARDEGLWQDVYDAHTELGLDIATTKADAAVAMYADEIVRSTQTPLGAQDISRMEASGAFVRIFMKFQGYFNNMMNLSSTEFQVISRDIGYKGNKPGRFFYLYLAVIAAPAIVAEGIAMAAGGDFDDLDEKDSDEVAATFFKLFVVSQGKFVANFLPGAGAVANFLWARATPQFWDDKLSVSPVISIGEQGIAGATRVVMDVIEYAQEGEFNRDASAMVKDTLGAIGIMLGLPTNWFSKPLTYLMKINEGNADPEHVGDYVQGFLRGRDGTED